MNKETVLIIEDSQTVRHFLRDDLLEPDGYAVLAAANGRDGWEQVQKHDPDLILLDLNLPQCSGLEVLETLRGHQFRTPVIVISAHDSPDNILKAFRMGAKNFLQKPFRVPEARKAINAALEEERLRRKEERLRREKKKLMGALVKTNNRLKKQLNQWVALHNIAQAITSTLEEKEIYKRVMANVNRILQVEAGSILLLDPKTRELHFAVTLKQKDELFSDLKLEPGQGIAGWVAENERSLIVPDVQNDERFSAEVDDTTGFTTQSILCVPLTVREKVIGVLEVINKLQGPERPSFTQDDQQLLEMLGSWVAVAVENSSLSRKMRELAALKTLTQAETTLAHYINNPLMNLTLELDLLKAEGDFDEQVHEAIESAHSCVREISAVIKSLGRLEEIRTVPYIGKDEMLDIEVELQKVIQYLEERKQNHMFLD
jgi:DNA-binding response OmpR family regulator